MRAQWLGRLALVVPTFIGTTLLAFLLVHLIPGDPVQRMAGERRLDPAFYAETMHRLGLDRPLAEQYFVYLWKVLHLDLGQSFVTQEPVWSEFARLFPATVELAVCAMLLAVVLGVPAGVLAAVRRGSWPDHALMSLAVTGFSMPIFWWGLLLIMGFSVGMRELAPALALPVAGRIDLEFDVPARTGFMVLDAWWSDEPGALRSALAHLVLPSVVLGTVPLAVLARMTRASMLEVLSDDYVRTAHAKGLTRWRVVCVHALRNALLPLLTVAGMLTGSLFGGAVLTETIFAWPGVGKWLIDAIGRRDYPVLQGGILITATIMIVVNLTVDALYTLADPRLRKAP
jgi:dipeptide transport system permease protein